MSKEQLTTIAATIVALVTILAFLWDISNRISEMEKRLGALESAVSANMESISELRVDVREIRGIVNSHLDAHATQAMLSEKTAESQ